MSMPASAFVEAMASEKKRGKFGNVQRGWFKIGSKKLFFRSKWEANYALYLNFLKKQGEVKRWAYEDQLFIFEKIQFGTRSYRPDFKVWERDGSVAYHEIKGYMTSKSNTQLKRMAKYFPDIKVILVDSAAYKDIHRKLGKTLSFF